MFTECSSIETLQFLLHSHVIIQVHLIHPAKPSNQQLQPIQKFTLVAIWKAYFRTDSCFKESGEALQRSWKIVRQRKEIFDTLLLGWNGVFIIESEYELHKENQ
jgi:hypothetical protein